MANLTEIRLGSNSGWEKRGKRVAVFPLQKGLCQGQEGTSMDSDRNQTGFLVFSPLRVAFMGS